LHLCGGVSFRILEHQTFRFTAETSPLAAGAAVRIVVISMRPRCSLAVERPARTTKYVSILAPRTPKVLLPHHDGAIKSNRGEYR